ncbi:MAG: hypothetical protein KME05_06480 [Gloeocapsa sp. UFS-A4-WI-NPMV-4B04]|jgi:uncharacterized membrane protein|nr:hypothetical protein [Gloeocapsa sp. UFS-A4-WI-NPMV-4B04]
MANKLSYQRKGQAHLIPLVGGLLGFLLGISGLTNNLILEKPESFFKEKLVNVPHQVTALSFIGFRALFLTYVGLSAGLVVSDNYSKQNKSGYKS